MVRFEFYDPDEEKGAAPKKKARAPKRKRKGSSFTMDWVSELGWSSSPFEKQGFPIAAMEDERQEVNLFFVKQRKFGVIYGGEGCGKTTLLNWLHEELKDYKEIDCTFIDAATATTDDRFRSLLADEYRGIFKRGTPISREQLVTLISDKARGKYVLLVDNLHLCGMHHLETLEALMHLDTAIICTSQEKVPKLPAKDELGLVLKHRSPSECRHILQERIEAVGGEDIKPFTNKVVKVMCKDTDSVKQFLDLAQETAINIALKRVTLDDEDVSEEELASKEERKAEKKKGISKGSNKDVKKRKYDELIESLTEELE